MTQQQLYTIRIGKQGITTTIIDEIKRQLKQHNRVKVKFLPTAAKNNEKLGIFQAFDFRKCTEEMKLKFKDKKKVAQEIAGLAKAKIVQRIGFTVVVEKK